MSDTHPNAYLQEAQEKRAEAAQAIAQAEVFEAKAYELDPSLKPTEAPTAGISQEEQPPSTDNQPPKEEQPDNLKKK